MNISLFLNRFDELVLFDVILRYTEFADECILLAYFDCDHGMEHLGIHHVRNVASAKCQTFVRVCIMCACV